VKLVPNFISRRPQLHAIYFWIFALIAIAVMVNWIAMPIVAGRLITTMPVPNVVNMLADEAETTLTKAGLNVKWAKEGRYSSEIKKNHVLIQMPAAGRTVKENRTVFLTISKGVPEVSIPGSRGQSLRQVEISLQRLELLLGGRIEGAHSEIPRGAVIRTEPDSGKMVRVGTRVDIIVSSGKKSGKTLLPSLLDMSLSKATELIDTLGFKLAQVIYVQLEDKLPNTVVEMSPKPGEYLDPETEIDLTVVE